MSTSLHPRRVALLWRVAWNDETVLECGVYRDGADLHLRVESATGVIVFEQIGLQPRAIARARALRESLKRRGWEDLSEGAPTIGSGEVELT